MGLPLVEVRAYTLLLWLLTFTASATQIASLTMVPAFFGMWAPHRVRVGLDGVEVLRRGRTQFHPYAEVKDVVLLESGVALETEDGTRIPLHLPSLGRVQREAVFATVRRALEHYRRAGGSPLGAERLARKGRAVSAWLSELRGVETGAGYREGELDDEGLAQVLRDPTAEPTSRVGAAFLLARSGSTETVQRIRDASVHPQVRVALDAAMDDDEEALDAITAELERERRTR